MSISYSGLTNYGKHSLPSVDNWAINTNILRDPPKSITTRRINKVGQTSSITEMIDDSENRACETIRQYARGVNPFVSVSYNNTNGGGLGLNSGKQAYLPYRIARDGAFRPPVVKQEELLPLSRLPRVWTTAFTQPGFADFSKKMLISQPASKTKEVYTEKLKTQVRPTATFKINKPIDKPYEVKYVIQKTNNVSGTSGLRTMDLTNQHVQEPTKGIDYDSVNVYVHSNSSDKKYINNNEFNPDRYLQDNLNTSVVSKTSAPYLNTTSIENIIDLSDIKTKNTLHTDYITPLCSSEKTKYIHNDIVLDKKVPSNFARTNTNDKNVHVKIEYDNNIELERNLPIANAHSNIGRSTMSVIDKISSRDYKLVPKIVSGGEFQGKESMPMKYRTQVNIELKDNKRDMNKKISETLSRYQNYS